MVYTEWKPGDRIKICAKVEDFYTTISQFLYLDSADIEPATSPCSITCARPNCAYGGINTSNREVVFQSVRGYSATINDVKCSNVRADRLYYELGRAISDSSGIATLFYTVTEQDRLDYEDAKANGKSYDIVLCLTDPLANSAHAITFYSIIIQSAPLPTHYISLSLGFVPPELITYFQTYINEISDQLMTRIAPPPSPWQYLRTTYDGVKNAFNIWLYLPPTAVLTMSLGGDIMNFLEIWVPVVISAIFAILAILVGLSGFWGLFILFSAAAIISWALHDAKVNQVIAETKATNLTIQLQQNNKEDQARNGAESVWVKSAKLQSDCLTRLQSHRDIHLAKLNGFIDQYAKYPGLVTELTKEKDTFTTNANNIITEFKTVPYITSVCDTYFVRLNSEISTSNTAINDSLGRYIKPDETYSIACKGWTNQKDCETAECFWYDSSCHKEEACWIPSPVGCMLSARTGKIIAGTVVLIGIIGAAYWVATRHPGETKAIITGAREAAREEVARAKTALKGIIPPRIPGKVVPRYA